jgi:glycerophosphoryl diester phosphodiesterase
VIQRPLLVVAHRAGNHLGQLRAALDGGADLVEGDVHLFRGALEMRHRKAIGPHLYWERWTELNRRRNLAVPELADVLATAAGDARLMLDLKGPSRAVAASVAEVLRETAPGHPITVCTKQWGMFDAFDTLPHVRRVFSASSRPQLARLRARLRRSPAQGVSIRLGLLDAPVVAELRALTGMVLTWPVDTDQALQRARRIGVDGVITKSPTLLARLLADRVPARDAA